MNLKYLEKVGEVRPGNELNVGDGGNDHRCFYRMEKSTKKLGFSKNKLHQISKGPHRDGNYTWRIAHWNLPFGPTEWWQESRGMGIPTDVSRGRLIWEKSGNLRTWRTFSIIGEFLETQSPQSGQLTSLAFPLSFKQAAGVWSTTIHICTALAAVGNKRKGMGSVLQDTFKLFEEMSTAHETL